MAWSFNPFTGNLDLVGGGGAVVFEGEVETFADLPETIGDPAVGASFLVRSSTGVWLVNRRQAGIWIRRNNTGVRATDWEYGGDYPVNSVNGQTGNVSLTAGDVGASATGHTHAAADVTSGVLDNARVNFAAPAAIGSTTRNTGAFTTLSANNGTLTASAPVLDLSQTWNNAAVTFTGLKFNVTATAAASNSMFADIQAGGYSQFAITRISSTSNAVWVYNTNSGTNTNGVGANYERGFVRWSSNIFQIGNEAAGTGSARHCAIVAGSNSYIFYNNGEAVSPLSWVANNSGALRFDTRARIASPADSVLRLTNNAATDFDRLQFGGTTGSFPALKRSSTTLQVRLADDSAYSVLDAQLRAQGTAPATSGATGTAGDIRYDADYIYICTAANTWKRAAIATW